MPAEVTATASLGAESLTLVATMTRSSAARVSGFDAGARAFSTDRLGLYEPERRAAAGHLNNVKSNGSELEPRAASCLGLLSGFGLIHGLGFASTGLA